MHHDDDRLPELMRRLAVHGVTGQGGTDPVMVDVPRLRDAWPAEVRAVLDAFVEDLCAALDRRATETERDTCP
jgi:hypothetical protein